MLLLKLNANKIWQVPYRASTCYKVFDKTQIQEQAKMNHIRVY